jgi:hypothetical protein
VRDVIRYRFRKREIKEFERDLGTLERVETKDGVEITMSIEALDAIIQKAQKVHDAKPFFSVENLKIGLAGQAAVFYELKRNWPEGVEQMRIGAPDEYDILYRGFRSEIKTFNIHDYYLKYGISREPDSLMAVNLIKFHERHDSFYIGCLMVKYNKIDMMGFTTREAMELLDRGKVYGDYSRPHEPDAECVVVKKRCQFTHITKLDSAIDSMRFKRCSKKKPTT